MISPVYLDWRDLNKLWISRGLKIHFMSKLRHAHFTNWSKVAVALSDYGVIDEASAKTFLETADKDDNPFYYMVCYIKESQEIYTHGKIYGFSGVDSVKSLIDELAAEIADNEYVMAVALTELQTYKQENLVSGENIKTVNGESILGEGDLTVTADVDLTDYITWEDLETISITDIDGGEVIFED